MLDGAITAVRRNPKATLGLSAIVMTLAGIISTTVTLVMASRIHAVVITPAGQPMTGAQVRHLWAQIGEYIVPYLALVLLVSLLASETLGAMLSAVVGHGVLGRMISIGEAWRITRPRLGSVFGSLILGWLAAGVVVLGGCLAALLAGFLLGLAAVPLGVIAAVLILVAAVVVAVVLVIRFAVGTQAVVLEGCRPVLSLRRSWRLVRKSSSRVFGILLLTSVIVAIAASVLQIPFTVVSDMVSPGSGTGLFGAFRSGPRVSPSLLASIITGVGTIVATAVSRPVYAGTTVLLYTDLRMRREGLDIALQAATSGAREGARETADQDGQDFGAIWDNPPGQQPPPDQPRW